MVFISYLYIKRLRLHRIENIARQREYQLLSAFFLHLKETVRGIFAVPFWLAFSVMICTQGNCLTLGVARPKLLSEDNAQGHLYIPIPKTSIRESSTHQVVLLVVVYYIFLAPVLCKTL